jgi:deferrochelatase/peroxidase EfeB
LIGVSLHDLTITYAVGASLFDDRYGLARRKPSQLENMPAFPNDEPHADQSHGDLLVQVCSATPEGCNHTLRRVMRVTRDALTLRWMLPGFQEPNTLGTGRASQRNLMGFKDGTANLDSGDESTTSELVWVSASDDEPSWAVDGTYMVARRIRMRVEFWDRTALHTQEAIIGRLKDTGAPLDGVYETDVPAYASDQDGSSTPLTAHIRLANPRRRDREEPASSVAASTSPRGSRPTGSSTKGCCSSASNAASPMASSRCRVGSTARHSRSTSGRSVAASTSRFRVSAARTDTSARACSRSVTVMSDSRQPGGTARATMRG